MLLAACGSSAPAAPPPAQGLVLDRPTPQTRAAGRTSRAGRLAGRAAGQGRRARALPVPVPGRVPARHRRLHRARSATCAPPGWRDRVVFVEATVDPGRDTVARLAAYQKEFGADWDLWTGTPADIAAFWKPFGVDVPDRARGAAAQDGLVDRPAADLRRRPHRRLHPHRRRRPRALRRRHGAEREGRARTRSCAGSSTTAACTTSTTPRHPTGPRPTPWPPSAGCSAPTSRPPARDGRVAAPHRPRRPGSPRRPRPGAQRLRRRRRDDALVPADHRHLAHAHAAALPGRARSSPRAAATRSTTSSPTRRRTAPASTTAASSSGRPSSRPAPLRVGKGVDRVPRRHAAPPRRVDPALLRRPPALHLQPRRLARHGHGPGHRPGRRPLVRARRQGAADHDDLQRHAREANGNPNG